MSTDRELLYVARYLLQVANHDDLTQLDHSRFKKCKLPLLDGVSDPLKLAEASQSDQSSNSAPQAPPSSSDQPPQ